MILAISISFVLIVLVAIVVLNERYGLLSCDRFPSAGAKYFAYAWLGALLVLLAFLITGAALKPVTSAQLAKTPFYSIFTLHGILIVFLAGWWLATGRPGIREFLNIRYERPGEVAAIGLSVGVGGWIVTLLTAMMAVLILKGIGLMPEPPKPPAMIGWMAALPIWKKIIIVLTAMTVEEAFFRSFLQKRIGLLASTLLFALAHFTYGNPLLLIGVTIISLVIGAAFYRTKNVIPGVIAHGVFDGIQLFVIVPIAVRLMGM
jgi:membrane protease YdiL (CAAX protease family)